MDKPDSPSRPKNGPDHDRGVSFDPSENVKALSEAASQRQDDLRELSSRLTNEQIHGIKDLFNLRSECLSAEIKLRAEQQKEVSVLESNRLNAIRQVDVLAGSTAAAQALAAIQVLAATTAVNAENLRNALNATAATIAAQTAGIVAGITERIAALEKSSYEGKGKQAVSDPMMSELVAEMKRFASVQHSTSGKAEGSQATVAYIVAGISALIGIGGFVMAMINR